MNANTPGLFTVVQHLDYARLAAHGYRWASFQHWNQGPRGSTDAGEWDFAPARAAGMEAGVWACVYEGENFYGVARNAAARAVELGASHLILDVEYALIGTYPGGAKGLIDGCRAGGWSGPVHLSTLGAPDKAPDGSFYSYDQDLDSFRQTGGYVMPQAYTNQHAGYAPAECVAYYTQKGVPADRLNLTIWPNGSLPASEWVAELQAAGLGPAVSIFLPESTTDGDFTTLEALTKPPAPEPAPDPRLSLDERLPQIRDNAVAELTAAKASFAAYWAANPGEAQKVMDYLAAIADGQPVTPPTLATHKGRGIIDVLAGGAALIGRLP